jgi:cytochrome subunit of sulfide dehydrogenase
MWSSALVSIVLLASLHGATAGAAERASAALANACAACHGPDGRSQGAIPTIAGMPASEFVAKMNAFGSSPREATIMDRIARGLSQAEIDGLASYFARLR